MGVTPGGHPLGPDRGRIVLRTFRDGLGARAGHDLTIELARWSGELTVAADGTPAALAVRADLGSLTVLEGTGGVKPLSDKDRQEIVTTARKVLRADSYPEAVFQAQSFQPGEAGGGEISGTFTVAGREAPLRLRAAETGPGRYHVTGTVVQSGHGIKPYTAFLGALRVRDAVDVEADLELPAANPAPGS